MTVEQDVRSKFDRAMLRSPNYLRVINNLSIDLYGGDTLALTYTTGKLLKKANFPNPHSKFSQ